MRSLILIALLAAVASASMSPYAIWQFRKMIMCVIPGSSPILDYNGYGCNCGFGGSESEKYVDELDKCCLNHDKCYRWAKDRHCRDYIDSPYIEHYSYSCSGEEITCSNLLMRLMSNSHLDDEVPDDTHLGHRFSGEGKNNPCESDICNCDRTAALCFAESKYNSDNKNVDRDLLC
ncbi:phospholipase A2, minor isoenzyme-like [Chiloscyllium punctatum]|uniref:phospholipase A2, minor isoenzyme-like n=1 Tax=Chiloscyllium punctatum TaxID=137246 RepID=UPI003B632260